MVQHHLLHLGRVDVEPAGDEHVLDPVGDVDVAGRVHHPHVAGVEPPVGVDGLGRGLRVVDVAGHDVVAPHQDLPRRAPGGLGPVGLRHLDLDAVDGPARGGRDDLGGIVVAAHGGHPGGLGQPVAGEHGLEAEPGPHLGDQRHRHRGRAGDGQPQRRHVEGLQVGVVQDHPVDSRGAGQHRDPLDRYALHHRSHVEHRVGDHGRPGDEAGQYPGLEAEGVEEGVDDQVPVAPLEPHHLRPAPIGATDRPVRQHGPLGLAGGARGEHDVADVAGGHRRGPGGPLGLVGLVGPGQKVGESHGAADGAPHDHDLAQGGGTPGSVQHPRVVGAEEVGDGEQQPGPGPVQHVGGLGAFEPGVDRHRRGPGRVGAQGGHHPLPDVGSPDPDPLARAHPRRHQRPAGPVGLV